MTAVPPPMDATPLRRFALLGTLLVLGLAFGWAVDVLPMTAEGWLPVLLGGAVGLVVWAFLLPRVIPSFTIRIALLALVGAVAGWILVSPLFLDRVVEEAAPGTVANAGDSGAPGDAAGGGSGGGAAAGAAATRLSEGQFEGLGHSATGTVALYELDDGSSVVRLEEVDIQNGPDLFVYLVPEPGQSNDAGGVNLGALKGNVGSSNYPVPADVDVSKFSTVLIWCRAFSTPFANATLAGS